MKSRRFSWLLSILLALLGICLVCLVAGYLLVGDFLPSLPEAFFGQLTLARETRPPLAKEYKSAEFLLLQAPTWQVTSAAYITTGDDAYFWDPVYAGFARTPLENVDVQLLQQALSAGRLFQASTGGDGVDCVVGVGEAGPRLVPCADGQMLMDRFAEIQGWSKYEGTAGVLVAHLLGGGLVEIRVYRTEEGVAYEAREAAGPWWLKGVSEPVPQVYLLAERVQVKTPPLLWPDMSEADANERAARILGEPYDRAMQAALQAPEVQAAFGQPLVLRPALATNIYASWMDSTSITLTLAANGPLGEGVLLVRGDGIYQIEIVMGGKRLP